ncbi:MAG: DUF305 domain-containing protein [Chloroflexi bacterium]|nr:DUF305 domain-containing protein [Chloroflexota bacterium]
MKTRLLWPIAPFALAMLLVFAPSNATPSRAQLGDMMGQPLDQLTGDDFDKAFLSQMTMHHGIAVMMARPTVANASHQEVKDLAQSIINDQTKEIGQMRGWAKDWYGLEIADPVAMMDQMIGTGSGQQGMPGMHGPGLNMPGMNMPGMMPPGSGGMPMNPSSMNQMNDMSMMGSMSKLPPGRLEVVFLSMMIPHHQGALDMAKLVPDRAAHQELKDLATSIVSSQSAEIDKMNGWLQSWYGL